MWGVANITQNWPLIGHLWTGWLAQDVDKVDQLKQLGEIYRVCINELQVLLLATANLPNHWVDVLPFMTQAQLLADTYNLGHFEWDKLLSTLCRSYW